MNVNVDVHLSGKYTFYKNGELVAETTNLITDGGMSRVANWAGSSNINDWCDGLAGDLAHIVLGSGTTPELYGDYNLDVGETAKYSAVNMSAITGMKFSRTSDNKLQTLYTVGKQININAPFTVSEVGTGRWPNNNQYSSTSTAPVNIYSLFSRATLGINSFSTVAGDIVIAVYTLTVIIPDDTRNGIDFHYTSSPAGIPLGNLSYSVRDFPFTVLYNTGIAGSTCNNATVPTFEGTYSDLTLYVIDFYTNITGVSRSTLTPTMSTNLTGYIMNSNRSIPDPVTLKLVKRQVCTMRRMEQVGNTFKTVYKFLFAPGSWPTTAIAFKYRPLPWMYTNHHEALVTDISKSGILTIMDTPYNPYTISSDMYVGLDYTFNYTRD
jgi:hypothetical protein